MMKEWETGVPVECGPDWNWNVVTEAVHRGPHPTAMTDYVIALFADDIAYQQKAGSVNVFNWEELQQRRPANLKISPVAVVP